MNRSGSVMERIALPRSRPPELARWCSTNAPKQTSIPWSRPQSWEGQIPGMGQGQVFDIALQGQALGRRQDRHLDIFPADPDALGRAKGRDDGLQLAGNRLDGLALGDAWPHPLAGGEGPSAGWMPFHKLSQWLIYSLFEPFEWAGITVNGRNALTGLPEYRNGGLLIDSGVLSLRDPALAARQWQAGDALIIEWRALTVHLIDVIADRVRVMLGRSANQLPLACVLEGGTWAAGRAYAAALRDGQPPLDIVSDGTIF